MEGIPGPRRGRVILRYLRKHFNQFFLSCAFHVIICYRFFPYFNVVMFFDLHIDGIWFVKLSRQVWIERLYVKIYVMFYQGNAFPKREKACKAEKGKSV